jgi:ABC-type branched-subunit amino acid transport system substrate-binding protein
MQRWRWVTVGMLATLVVAATTAAAGAQTGERPRATEVGITAREFHIAVVADVESALAPNLFRGSVDGVLGVAKYLNANGGLAGRKVVVDFYDSQLNPDITRDALISGCQNDAVMVGTSAIFLASVGEMRNCRDATGAAIGIPDIPFVTATVLHQCSDESFPVVPPVLICSTKDQHPQTYQSGIGRAFYFQQQHGKHLHGIYIFTNGSKATRDDLFAGLGALRDAGIKSDGDFDLAANAPQSQFTDVVRTMKKRHSNYAQCTLPYTCMVALRKEATLQGLTGVTVWDCTVQCYDARFLASGGSDVEGNYVSVPFLPFYNKADQRAVPMLANFVKYTGPGKLNSYAAYAWAAGIALRDAVKRAVAAHGVNGVTRKTIFEQLDQIHKFSADGFFAPFDLAGRRITTCGVIMQVRHGEFVRVVPTKPGTYACTKGALDLRKLDLLGS